MTLRTSVCQASLSFTISWSLLKLMSIKSVMLFNHLFSVIFFSSHLQSFPASGYFPLSWLFASGCQNIGASASALLLPMSIQSLLQQHNLKASILQSSAFFMVQLAKPYMTTGKTIALTTQIFVGKVMSLPFNTLG